MANELIMARHFNKLINLFGLLFIHTDSVDEKLLVCNFDKICKFDEILGSGLAVGENKIERFKMIGLPVAKLD